MCQEHTLQSRVNVRLTYSCNYSVRLRCRKFLVSTVRIFKIFLSWNYTARKQIKSKQISGGNLPYPFIPLNHHNLTVSAFVVQIAILLSEFPYNYLKQTVASPLSNFSSTLETSIRKATIRVKPLLGAFGKRLQRAVTEFVISVRPSTWSIVTPQKEFWWNFV